MQSCLRGGSREQREPKPGPPAGSRQQKEPRPGRPGISPGLPLPRKLRPSWVGLVPLSLPLPTSTCDLPRCVARFPESSWRLRSRVRHSGLPSQPWLLLVLLLVWCLGMLLRAPEFWVGTLLGLPLPRWLCRHEKLVGPHPDGHMHTRTPASFSELLGEVPT